VKSKYKLIRVELDQIKYIESQHEYISIHVLKGEPVVTQLSLRYMEEQLPSDRFMRVHRSYIVRLDRISVIERNRIVFDGKVSIPIGEQYKERFQKFMCGMV